MNSSSATTTFTPGMPAAIGAFSALVTISFGEQSCTRRRMPSGPKSVKSGTAIAPSLMAPKIAT